MSSQKPREIAARILQRHALGSEFVETLVDSHLAPTAVAGADRALCQELVYGVVRWQATLDWLIRRKTTDRPQKPALQVLLRLGLYQMFWLDRIPDHAAVHETVELAKTLGFGHQAGFINAILRGYARERAETRAVLDSLKQTDLATGFSHPEWLVRNWVERWGTENVRALLDWNNLPSRTFARVNTLKTDADKLRGRWAVEGVEAQLVVKPWLQDMLIFELLKHPALDQLGSFREGGFYVQDPSTILAVNQLGAKPGESILDVCAAPGGKATLIAQQMQNQGRIVARDTHSGRLDLVQQNCLRLGATCVEAQWTKSGPLPAPEQFDRVLVDVPCSNTGVMRRRVDLRWRLKPLDLEHLQAQQLQILLPAANAVKPGGTLIYSTCSIEPAENQGVIEEFLAVAVDFRMEEETTMLPFRDGVDGAYVARLVRTNATPL